MPQIVLSYRSEHDAFAPSPAASGAVWFDCHACGHKSVVLEADDIRAGLATVRLAASAHRC